jgi:hypothetical protein
MLAASLTAERSLSVVRCMKTYVTSTMKNDRLYLPLDWCIFTEILNTKNRFWKSLRNSCLSVIKIVLDSMLYETLKWPQIASFCISSKKIIQAGGRPRPIPVQNYGVHFIKPQLRPWWTSLTTSKLRIFAMVFSIFLFFKALLINEGESGRNDPVPKESGWINPTVGGHY